MSLDKAIEATKKLSEKDCIYCKDNMEGECIKENCSAELIIDSDFLYTYCKCGRHSVISINYCPMCGRKLGE